ncbi:cob(I)yrinic acid a,c-diamide adenosyltransferase [Salipaludibacillus keqinensis]|jgi:cob(I)alamin adenosyltransferase|uniref:Cob(I)yrinic acid a,c-diamide adenosyltransferase n=1 Tax=Salipaludibacillus keqinensis TaxID=2045207 RepID=A0A323TCD4_9BACI|nr:cob(I)yrinic acid a,c-diamide adenosyltransferase [Salipaludibacillus keqinensis]PYZ92306.1 cob(I)yrinic acid a,c-diamide adenosyltransferase [Salipaludibacillus keqinensis]
MNKNQQRGMTLVYTGNGKGKTTSAVGLAVRAAGHDFNVKIYQFIKSPDRTYGEQRGLKKLGIDMVQLGIGFTWTKTPEEHRDALKKGWPEAKEAIMSGEYDVIILDEINNALAIDSFPVDDVLPLEDVIKTIKERPVHVHLVLTGRDAHPKIKEQADLVSVVEPEKHYYDEGIPAIKGIEF